MEMAIGGSLLLSLSLLLGSMTEDEEYIVDEQKKTNEGNNCFWIVVFANYEVQLPIPFRFITIPTKVQGKWLVEKSSWSPWRGNVCTCSVAISCWCKMFVVRWRLVLEWWCEEKWLNWFLEGGWAHPKLKEEKQTMFWSFWKYGMEVGMAHECMSSLWAEHGETNTHSG